MRKDINQTNSKTPQELKDRGYSLNKHTSRLFIKPSDKLHHGDHDETFYARDIFTNPEKYNNTEVYHRNTKILIQIQDKKSALLLTYSSSRMLPENRMEFNFLLSTEYSHGNSIIANIDSIEASLQAKTIVADGLAVSGEYSLFVGFKQTGLTLCLLKAVVNQIIAGEVEAKNVIYITGNASKQGFLDITKILDKHGVETVYVDNLPISGSGTRPFVMKKELPGLMKHCIDLQEADKTVIIIDMLKNVCEMGSPEAIIKFNSSIRNFTMEGGTVLINASPNKNPGNDGNPLPPGFNDVIEGCNSLFIVTRTDDGNITTVKYDNESGASKDKEVYFQFENNCNIYPEVFNSCIRVSAEEIEKAKEFKDEFITLEQRAKDLENNIRVFKLIDSGVIAKTKLIEKVANRCSLSKPKAKEFLEKYTDEYWMCSSPKSGGGTKEYSTKYTEDLLQRDAQSNLCLGPYVEMEEPSCETLEYIT